MKTSSLLHVKWSVLCFFLFLVSSTKAQTFTDSNLPIIVITTDIDPATSLPYEIVDSPRVLGTMKVIKHPDGSRNYLTDSNTPAFLNYNGRLNIEVRGSSSQSLEKKGYGLTTLQADNVSNNNVSLLGMPSEHDWIFNGLAFDPSLIRDYLAYNTARQMGDYATRTQYFELVVNGDYRGLYLLQEKIKVDSNRVNILKIGAADTSGENLTGGYITKADKTTGNDPVAWTNYSYNGSNVDYIHDWPSPENVTVEQDTYIHNQFDLFQSAIIANNGSLSSGYPSLIDVPTFVDFMLSNELAANVDGYQFSTYFHKDRNGKLRAGPIWDFNLTLGNDLFQYGFDRSKVDTWQFSNGDNEGSKFWTNLFTNYIFKCYLSHRFHDLTQSGQAMNVTVLNTLIDTTVDAISEAAARENERWNTVPDLPLEIANLKSFLSNRIAWMTSHLGGYSACSNVAVPPLVITKINYHPGTTTAYPVSNDQEFIAIENTGSATVNLSGVYFRELGITYQFPYNSSVTGNSTIYLASNATVFQSQNGLVPFGQYTRNLSNKSQKLVLADAYGNIIDTVEYFDAAPWPTAPDGNGSYLQLVSTTLDNNVASSWIASTTPLSASTFTDSTAAISIYPNPTAERLTIVANCAISKVELYDVYGKVVQSFTASNNEVQLSVVSLATGLYFAKVFTENGIYIQKWIKH